MLLLLVLSIACFAGCDHGFAPPDEPATGTIRALVTYEGYPGRWPPNSAFHDLRFVAMRFVPHDTSDFIQLNRLVFSDRRPTQVPVDTVLIDSVTVGTFPYSGMAQKYGPNLLDWRPVGIYEENGGVFEVFPGRTTDVRVRVDFDHLPPFPPQ